MHTLQEHAVLCIRQVVNFPIFDRLIVTAPAAPQCINLAKGRGCLYQIDTY